MITKDHDLAAVPVCARLRSKMYYVFGREHPSLRASTPTAQYWCSLTTTSMGPDALPCRPESCQAHRSCFESS